ncbi:hypothetical protein EYF80_036983 [Liparis tanakae]|uniref:Uncharacterized protein n=1 Tax=Liparis tanakae TaxID=230148 RepID=A0A4Z2GHF6_9TELE|nr:hypothetical protein EYF80_036983 [Liparis tanakae]
MLQQRLKNLIRQHALVVRRLRLRVDGLRLQDGGGHRLADNRRRRGLRRGRLRRNAAGVRSVVPTVVGHRRLKIPLLFEKLHGVVVVGAARRWLGRSSLKSFNRLERPCLSTISKVYCVTLGCSPRDDNVDRQGVVGSLDCLRLLLGTFFRTSLGGVVSPDDTSPSGCRLAGSSASSSDQVLIFVFVIIIIIIVIIIVVLSQHRREWIWGQTAHSCAASKGKPPTRCAPGLLIGIRVTERVCMCIGL